MGRGMGRGRRMGRRGMVKNLKRHDSFCVFFLIQKVFSNLI
jgi:hypothetical protein